MTNGSTDALGPGFSAASPGLRIETQFSQILDNHQGLPPPSPLTPLGSEDELVDFSHLLSVFRKKKKPTRAAKSSSRPKTHSEDASATATKPAQCGRCLKAGRPCISAGGRCEGCKVLRKRCSLVPIKPQRKSDFQIRKIGRNSIMKYPTRASKQYKVGGKTQRMKDPPPSSSPSRWLRSSKRKIDLQSTLPGRQLRSRRVPEAPVTPRRTSSRIATGRTGERAARGDSNEHPVASTSVQPAANNGLLTPKSVPRKRPRNDAHNDSLPTPTSLPRKRRRRGTATHEKDSSTTDSVLPSEVRTDSLGQTLASSPALPSLSDCKHGEDVHPPAHQFTAHGDIATPDDIPVDNDLVAAFSGPCPPMFRAFPPPSSLSALSETPLRLAATRTQHGITDTAAPALPEGSAPVSTPPSAQHAMELTTAPAAAQEDLALDSGADVWSTAPYPPTPRALSPSFSLPAHLASPLAGDTSTQPEHGESSTTTPPATSLTHTSPSPTARSCKRKLDDIEDLPRLTRAQRRALEEEKKQRLFIRIPPLRHSEPILPAAKRRKGILGPLRRNSSTPRKEREREQPSSAAVGSTDRPGAEAVAVGHPLRPCVDATAVDDAMPQVPDAEPAAVDDPTKPDMALSSEKKERIWKWKVLEAECQNTTTRRPLPPGIRPRLWAQTRQEICETLPWFRTYQGGVYAKDAVPYGYLLAGFASPRDVFAHGGRVIISHTGGGQAIIEVEVGGAEGKAAKRPATTKKSVLQENQGETRSHQHLALTTAWKNQHPVVLLADRGYALFPFEFDADEMYYALGWYWVRDMWQEAEPNDVGKAHTRIKVCFQWVESQGRPWWCAQDEAAKTEGVELGSELRPQRRRPRKIFSTQICQQKLSPDLLASCCDQCKTPSKHVYRLNWMCLNAKCDAFWTLPDGTSPWGEGFELEPEFLALVEAPAHMAACIWDYCPQPPVVGDEDGFTTSRAFQKGFFCKECGRVSTRSKWECWQCPKCESRFAIEWPIHSSTAWQAVHGTQLWGEHQIYDPSVKLQQYTIAVDDNGTMACVNQFNLPNERGSIFQILGNEATNRVAEDILKLYQSDFVERSIFKRVPLASHRMSSVMLTQYFSQNSGVPYKYVAGTDTTIPFSEAPLSVNKALELITRRASLVAPRASFNELLTAGYLEGQMMNFHSDFEQGLGEDVAALSLGSPALMKFRTNRRGEHHAQLEFMLNHGDILVMHGAGIQENYEHTVIPTGFRIAATARLIDVARNNNERSARARKPTKLASMQNIELNASLDLSGMVMVDQAVRSEGPPIELHDKGLQRPVWMPEMRYNVDDAAAS